MKNPIKLVTVTSGGGRLCRSSRPDSIKDLVDNYISIAICLQSGMYESLTQDNYEDATSVLARNYITRYNIPCSDFTPPTREQVNTVMAIIQRFTAEGKRVLVHCLSGVDRTGYMIAAYRLKYEGWTYEQAKEEYIREGQHCWYRWWIPSLKKYATRH